MASSDTILWNQFIEKRRYSHQSMAKLRRTVTVN